MSLHPDDDLARIYRQTADEEPAAWLDERICAQAANAVRGREPLFERGVRWFPYFALAATVVLTTSTVLIMRTDPPIEPHPGPPSEERIAAVRPAAPADTQGPARPITPSAPARSFHRPEMREPESAGSAKSEKEQAGMSGPAGSSEALGDSKNAASVATSAAGAPHSLPSELSSKVLKQERGEPLTPAVPASSASAEVTKATRARQDAGAQSTAGESPAFEENPAEWLRRIEASLREGRESEARAALAAFRKKYPNYRIPPELE